MIETNPHSVKSLQQLGVPVFYGDATRPEVLKASAIEQADLLVITMSHTKTSQLLLQRALELNPTLATVARARYHGDVTLLYDAGASLVVYDEMESGVRFVSQTLSHLGASLQEAHTLALLARDGFEEQYHPKSGLMQRLQEHGRLTLLGDLQLEWVAVHPNGPLKGHSLEALSLRQRFGINVLCLFDAVSGDRHSVLPQRPLQPKDRLLVVGAHTQLQSLQAWLNDADKADTTEPTGLAY